MTRETGVILGALLLTTALAGATAVAAPARAFPHVTVFKAPGCTCCNKWVAHLRARGFEVTIDSTGKVAEVNDDHGVTEELASCHTALVGDYVVVGHVPADAIKKMLAERPSIVGISAPGMPIAAPGMEAEGVAPEPYSVIAFDSAGKTSVFAEYR